MTVNGNWLALKLLRSNDKFGWNTSFRNHEKAISCWVCECAHARCTEIPRKVSARSSAVKYIYGTIILSKIFLFVILIDINPLEHENAHERLIFRYWWIRAVTFWPNKTRPSRYLVKLLSLPTSCHNKNKPFSFPLTLFTSETCFLEAFESLNPALCMESIF